MELDARRMNTALHLQCHAVFMCQHLVPYVAAMKNPYPVTSFYWPKYLRPSCNTVTHQNMCIYLVYSFCDDLWPLTLKPTLMTTVKYSWVWVVWKIEPVRGVCCSTKWPGLLNSLIRLLQLVQFFLLGLGSQFPHFWYHWCLSCPNVPCSIPHSYSYFF